MTTVEVKVIKDGQEYSVTLTEQEARIMFDWADWCSEDYEYDPEDPEVGYRLHEAKAMENKLRELHQRLTWPDPWRDRG